ncbi:MAG: cobalamin biosynthesis protein [Rhizobiaceae bacterium]|nr:cobalamin biosynthesis protein [Rhizobiaceae bacterium]
MIFAGIGARKGVTVKEVLAAIDAAIAAHGLTRGAIAALCSNMSKAAELGIASAAKELGIECRAIAHPKLRKAAERTITRSGASIAATGLSSLSEAAALAAAGAGARLLGPRVEVGPVTCALATSEDAR